jgi:hypothetical protein
VDWSIRHEWVQALGDLIERRLMLAWSPRLSRDLLRVCAGRLSHAGKLAASDIDTAVAACIAHLAQHYGAKVP